VDSSELPGKTVDRVEIANDSDADDRDWRLLERNAHPPLDDPLKFRDRLVKGLLAEMRLVENRRNDRYFSHNPPSPDMKNAPSPAGKDAPNNKYSGFLEART